jgi:hypothetical protein
VGIISHAGLAVARSVLQSPQTPIPKILQYVGEGIARCGWPWTVGLTWWRLAAIRASVPCGFTAQGDDTRRWQFWICFYAEVRRGLELCPDCGWFCPSSGNSALVWAIAMAHNTGNAALATECARKMSKALP